MIPWVFGRLGGRQLGSLRKLRDRGCREAGIPGRVPHDMRRSAVRNMEFAGISGTLAMQSTGMKTESGYRGYRIVTRTGLAEAIKKLGGGRSR